MRTSLDVVLPVVQIDSSGKITQAQCIRYHGASKPLFRLNKTVHVLVFSRSQRNWVPATV